MELLQQRMSQKGNSTYSVLYLDGEQLCFTIEDIHRDIKIENETRIPAGRYQIKFREVLSPKTKRYRELYPEWFTWHLELQDVPEFTYVYIHQGNNFEHSSGCTLVNCGVTLGTKGDYVGMNSAVAFKELYPTISKALSSGKEVWLTIKDEDCFIPPF